MCKYCRLYLNFNLFIVVDILKYLIIKCLKDITEKLQFYIFHFLLVIILTLCNCLYSHLLQFNKTVCLIPNKITKLLTCLILKFSFLDITKICKTFNRKTRLLNPALSCCFYLEWELYYTNCNSHCSPSGLGWSLGKIVV